MPGKENIMYGFYSPKAAKEFGTATYEKMGGGEVEVTLVHNDPDAPKSYKWDDVQCVGEVSKFLGKNWRQPCLR